GQAAADPAPDRPPLLLAGPDLEHAPREVTEIARSYPGCRPLLTQQATVSAALQALDGAPLAHLAAHGHHDQENFLFSRIDLADGPLMAYDIQQLTAAPRHVVQLVRDGCGVVVLLRPARVAHVERGGGPHRLVGRRVPRFGGLPVRVIRREIRAVMLDQDGERPAGRILAVPQPGQAVTVDA